MAEIKKTINTRLVLRNDDLSNWESSDKVLLKGEAALAKRSDGLYEMRIGDGEHVWKDLSATGFGHTKFYEETALTALEAITDAPNGSIGIVTEALATGLSSKTAYTYNDSEKRWEALDGNYNAENVYFKSDFTLAGDYDKVGNIKLSDGTLAATGKSVKTLFEDIFDKTIQPSLSDVPTANCSVTSSGAKEVGTVFSPAWSTSLNQGKYYQSWNNTKVNDGTTVSAYTVSDNAGHSSTAASGTFDSFTVGDSTSYKVTSTIAYNAGTIAKDNKGNNSNPVVQRAAGSTAAKDSGSVTGYRKPFWGYKLTADKIVVANMTSAQVRGLQASGNSQGDLPTTYTVPADTIQIFFCCKHDTANHKQISVKNTSALNAPVAFTKVASGVQVEGLNSYEATAYDIFYAQFDAGLDAQAILAITWSN